MNALSEYLRERAARMRAAAEQRPEDPRYARSAQAIEALADHAEAGAQRGIFQMRYLLEHHIVDGRFAWPSGQSGRSIAQFGFDVPVTGEWDLEQFLMDLCDLAKSDATRHIGTSEAGFDHADAAALGQEFGIDVERIHQAIDTGRRLLMLYVVGIPAWHPLTPAASRRLEAIDGVKLTPGSEQAYGADPPLLVQNLPVHSEQEARALVAEIVGIDPGALGVTESGRVM